MSSQGFIDERKVRNGINQWLSNATSWEEPVFDMNYSETDRGEEKNPRQEMWLLYHEDNEQYAVEGVDTMIGGTTRRSGSDNMIDYINDPYSISFLSKRPSSRSLRIVFTSSRTSSSRSFSLISPD